MSAPLRRAATAALAVVVAAASVLLATPASAAPPAAPVVVSPGDGSTTSGTAPELSVAVSDPDGGQVPVRFEGRPLGATTPAPGSGDPFTIVALPDTQNYTYSGRQGTITQQTNWVVSTRSALRTAFVVHLGDLVSDPLIAQQWQNISTGLKVLDDAGVPNSVVPGNHDYDSSDFRVGTYDSWFPPSRYAGASWNSPAARYGGYLGQNQFGPDPVDRRNMDNYALVTAGGRDLLVLNLEWEAPQYALDWAHRVLAAYPDRIAILVTHSFVTVAGARRTTAERPGGTSTAALWSDFVSQHCSIRLVLSGHEHSGDAGEARRTDANSCGAPVQQILTDYQDRANGGDGWLRYYTFDPAANTVQATTYSPKLDRYETDGDSAFTLPFELGAPTPVPFTTIGTATVPSGSTATVRWTGLSPDTRYEWRAVAGDTGETTTSATATFRTPAAAGGVDDTFSRTITGGWGAADTGQRWSTVSSGAFSVDGSRGRYSVPVAGSRRAQLDDVRLRDVVLRTDLAVSPAATGSGAYVTVQGRAVAGGSYRAKVRFTGGTVTLGLVKVVGGVETALSGTPTVATVAAGAPVSVQLEITGTSPTTLRAKAWPSTAAEPTSWAVTGSDSTAALQVAGAVGLDTYLSSTATAPVTVALDRFLAADTTVTPPPNQSPTAVIATPVVSERTATLSGAGSTDPDGRITAWAWTFGDGTTATGAEVSHTWTADGSYPVTLTVTDDRGATATTTRTVTVAATPPPPNQDPTAVIATPVVSERTATLSGAGSTDPDGRITAWAWTFGDGTTATGAEVSHTWTADGSYPVTLTVTDDRGATATTTRTVTVATTPPPPTLLVADTFSRSLSGTWGTAGTGGSWTMIGAPQRFAVDGSTARQLTPPGQGADAVLGAVRAGSAELRAAVSWDRPPAEARLYSTLVVRAASTGSYRATLNVEPTGVPRLSLVRRTGSTDTTLTVVTVPGTVTAGSWYQVAVRTVPGAGGTTVLSAKAWPRGTSEPAAAQVTATDATAALQPAGWVGLGSYRSSSATTSVTTSFDDLTVTPLG